MSITGHTVGANVTVTTSGIIRNSFSGRASVAEGKNWSGTTNKNLTSWVQDDANTSIDVDCANGGCDTNFWLELKTNAGSGSVNYRLGTKLNSASTTWVHLVIVR